MPQYAHRQAFDGEALSGEVHLDGGEFWILSQEGDVLPALLIALYRDLIIHPRDHDFPVAGRLSSGNRKEIAI